jgi:PAS domain S-box-containing protein
VQIQDITEHKKDEEALKESEKVYREFFDNFFNGFALCEIITDEKGEPVDFVYLEVNKAFENFTGLKREEVLNKRVTDVLPYEEVAEIIQIYGKVALTGESTVFQYPIPSLGKYYEVNAFSPRKKQFITFFTDITDRKKAEEALLEAHNTLEQRVEERTAEIEEAYQLVKENEFKLKEVITDLERSNKELESFAYITSHDLQEPLRSIASYSQLIQRRYEGKLDSDADEFIEFMVIGAKRMKSMIQGLLEYSRVGTQGEEFKDFSAEEALTNALSNLQSSIEECNVEVTYDSLPTILGDKSQITNVFQNLIGNAIKYKKPQFPPRIHISSKLDKIKNEYVFSVSDNGIGIEKQYMDRIFEVFKRLHTIDEYEGTGIGLAIVKRIVERHGGRIWVESSFGEGSTFYFTIPVKE